MPSNPPSLWRRLTDCGALASKLRPALPPHLELPASEATLASVARRDGAPMRSGDWYDVAHVLSVVAPFAPVGVVNAAQVATLRAGAPEADGIITALQDWRRQRGGGFYSLGEGGDAAGLIRLRPDGSIPARTQARRDTVAAPWQVSSEAAEAASVLATRWGVSASAAVSRALTERLARELAGEASLFSAVENAAKTQANKKSAGPKKKDAHKS